MNNSSKWIRVGIVVVGAAGVIAALGILAIGVGLPAVQLRLAETGYDHFERLREGESMSVWINCPRNDGLSLAGQATIVRYTVGEIRGGQARTLSLGEDEVARNTADVGKGMTVEIVAPCPSGTTIWSYGQVLSVRRNEVYLGLLEVPVLLSPNVNSSEDVEIETGDAQP